MNIPNNLIETTGVRYKDGFIIAKNGLENYISFEAQIEKEGLYEVTFEYFHYDWDLWANLVISCDKGEFYYKPSFPRKRKEISVPIFLSTGKNKIKLSPDFGHELYIKSASVSDEPIVYNLKLTPSENCLYLDNPRTLHSIIDGFDNPVVSVKCSDTEIPFELKSLDLQAEYSDYTGYKLFKSHIFLDLKNTVLSPGEHTLYYYFKDGKVLEQKLKVFEKYQRQPLKIISFDVDHGNASLICLPNGKNLLVDSGYKRYCKSRVLPYLEREKIKVDYFLLTHHHNDHSGALDEILSKYSLNKPDSKEAFSYIQKPKEERYKFLSNYDFIDNNMLLKYDNLDEIWDLGGVKIKIMNSRFDETGEIEKIDYYKDITFNEHNYENATSASFLLHFGEFGYYHGADTYAYAQEKNLQDFKKMGKEKELVCSYYYANHHFHCDVSVDFIRAVNPKQVYIPTNYSAYSRSAYAEDFVKGVAEAEFENKRITDALITIEIGSAVVEAEENGNYTLTTYFNAENIK